LPAVSMVSASAQVLRRARTALLRMTVKFDVASSGILIFVIAVPSSFLWMGFDRDVNLGSLFQVDLIAGCIG